MLGIPTALEGHAAGLTTSILWTGTSLSFTAASRRIGPTAVNAIRISFAMVLLALTHRLRFDAWIPAALPRQVWLLAFSGVIGLVIGDQALFTAFVEIGPRLSTLIMTSAPLMAALCGWVALGEALGPTAWIGVALTVGGVAWVVLERPRAPASADPRIQPVRHRARGIILGFVAAACQTVGYLLSKQGIGHGWLPDSELMDPQAATFLRMFFAGLGMVPVVLVYGLRERKERAAGVRPKASPHSRRSGVLLAMCGAMVGPYLGVWMSLVAADKVPLGVAQTLCSLPPVLILPFVRFVYQEHISKRAVAGAVLAVAGVAVLFL